MKMAPFPSSLPRLSPCVLCLEGRYRWSSRKEKRGFAFGFFFSFTLCSLSLFSLSSPPPVHSFIPVICSLDFFPFFSFDFLSFSSLSVSFSWSLLRELQRAQRLWWDCDEDDIIWGKSLIYGQHNYCKKNQILRRNGILLSWKRCTWKRRHVYKMTGWGLPALLAGKRGETLAKIKF